MIQTLPLRIKLWDLNHKCFITNKKEKVFTLNDFSDLPKYLNLADCIAIHSTGFIDEYGQEIFEGDIIKSRLDIRTDKSTPKSEDELYVVRWFRRRGKFIVSESSLRFKGLTLTISRKSTIVGNVFQNKDLLDKVVEFVDNMEEL